MQWLKEFTLVVYLQTPFYAQFINRAPSLSGICSATHEVPYCWQLSSKEQTKGEFDANAWFYGALLNQLWRILEKAYNRELKSKEEKPALFK